MYFIWEMCSEKIVEYGGETGKGRELVKDVLSSWLPLRGKATGKLLQNSHCRVLPP
jgi:hypothetical protein